MKRILVTCLVSTSLSLLAKTSSTTTNETKSKSSEATQLHSAKNSVKTEPSEIKKAAEKLEIGEKVPDLPENSNMLARVSDGGVWSQKDLVNKLAVLFYVAPSEKDLNHHVADGIKKANLNKKFYSSYAIINMEASTWPNWILSWKLGKSQKEFASTTYIKDYKRVLIDKWGLKDNSNDVVVLKNGKVLFVHKGKLSQEKTKQLILLLTNEVALAMKTSLKKTLVTAKAKDKKTNI